ncbi:MAG: sulfotransferase family 2 domain-containing protein [Methylocapsa sp.]|nr:sulfotransferase family 2 domain-containing protein [Methylocapsa sp.]
MIISDDYRFAFIHIPKCAGSSVSAQLAGIDSYHGKFSGDGPHDQLGYIYFCHLPLQTLHDHFPEEFRKVTEYDSVAFVREPQARFASALMQYVRTYKIPQFKISVHAAAAEAAGVIEHLRKKPQTLEAAYSMFLPQTSFTTLNHKVLIKHLFLLGQMAEFADFVRMKTGICFRAGNRENQSAVPRSAIVKDVSSIFRHVYVYLPQSARYKLKMAAVAYGLYKSATQELSQKLSENHEIRNFIDDYYAEDIMLFKSLRSAQTRAASSETAAA